MQDGKLDGKSALKPTSHRMQTASLAVDTPVFQLRLRAFPKHIESTKRWDIYHLQNRLLGPKKLPSCGFWGNIHEDRLTEVLLLKTPDDMEQISWSHTRLVYAYSGKLASLAISSIKVDQIRVTSFLNMHTSTETIVASNSSPSPSSEYSWLLYSFPSGRRRNDEEGVFVLLVE
ncbi:hypothetical protein M501DRAFT_990432 [Patellaria atrata CBS 101060]|uniref:Uncharacterized protein n=1 Tax=Patellaria atrata CBS 101060 TaxID=1346257 RepID=A0A9P4S385_9PEZI|nr:hypothetical protein M501DRAFT_990432 [Patellaria atrata CBS 101060]